MSKRLRTLIAPAYLLACLLIGGSIQGVGFVLALQFTGIALLAWALLDRSPWRWRPQARALPWMSGALLILCLLQLMPLPPGLWSSLPGRAGIADGYRLLGQPLPWRPISLSADSGIGVLLTFIPPAALVVLIVKARASTPLGLAIAVALATLVSIGLGFAQVASGGRFYLYPWVVQHTPAGLFANPNHAAALLLAAIPFVAAYAAARWSAAKKSSDRAAPLAIAGLFAALLALAIATNGSLAIVLLGLPVAVASAFLFLPAGRVRLARIAALIALLLAIGAGAMAIGAGYGLGDSGRVSLNSRQDMWQGTAQAIADHWLTGSGLGTFADVYPLREDPAKVTRAYVNHAHNDYLELALELGIAGIALILLFLAWWTRLALAIWRSPGTEAFARAATIASAALLLHSLVDFPLRTAALAALFGAALGLMAAAEKEVRSRDGRKARHVRIEELA